MDDRLYSAILADLMKQVKHGLFEREIMTFCQQGVSDDNADK